MRYFEPILFTSKFQLYSGFLCKISKFFRIQPATFAHQSVNIRYSDFQADHFKSSLRKKRLFLPARKKSVNNLAVRTVCPLQ